MPLQDRPPLQNVFFGFRIMLGIGVYMIAAALFGAWLLWRGRLFETRWYLENRLANLVGRLRRGDRRLGGDRKRPAAVDRLWHFAHRGRGFAGAGRQRRDDACALRPGLSHCVLVRHLFHQPADRAGNRQDAELAGDGAALAAGQPTFES